MQPQLEFQFLVLITTILFACIIYIIFKEYGFIKAKYKLEESNRLREKIIQEESKTRHEYNNLFQTVVNLIEAEEMEELIGYKSTLLKKVHLLSSNSMLQLGKIKSESVLQGLYQLYQTTQNMQINLNITVYNEITWECPYEMELYSVLEECIKSAIIMAESSCFEITLGLGENEKGLHFLFESVGMRSASAVTTLQHFEDTKLRKLLTYNAIRKDSKYTQEIMITRHSANKNK